MKNKVAPTGSGQASGEWRVASLLLLAAFLFLQHPAMAQTVPHVTGTFKTPGNQTPSAAGLKQIATIGIVAVYGSVDFQPYDSSGNKPTRILCGGVTYIPQKVRAWIKGDGTLVDNITGAAGVDLVPESGCTPTGLVMRATITLAPSSDGRIASVTWTEDKTLPQQASVDWGSLAAAGITAPTYTGYSTVQDEGVSLTARNTVNFIGAGVACADNALSTRTDCTITGGGGGGATHQVNGVNTADQTTINFQNSAKISFSNPSLGNVQASVAAGSIQDADLAGSIAPAKIAGTAEVQTNKNALNGYAGLNASGLVPLNRGGTAADLSATGGAGQYVKQSALGAALSVGTIPAGDLPSHAHAAADIASGVLAYARGGFGAIATLADQVFLSTSASAAGWSSIADCSNATTAKLLYATATHSFSCGTDQTGVGGSGITSLNGLTPTTQTFAKTDDSNVTLGITSAGSTHTFAMGWLGMLANSRGGTGQNSSAATGVPRVNAGTWSFDAKTTHLADFSATAPTTDGKIPIWNQAALQYQPGDPIVSYNYANLLTAAAATAMASSASPARLSTFSNYGTLFFTFAGITGSPTGCTVQIKSADSLGNLINNGTAIGVTPANGTTSSAFSPAAALPTGAQMSATYSCTAYPTAGTVSVDYVPGISAAVINTPTVNLGTLNGAATEATLAALNTKIPSSPATDRTTAAAPFAARLTDGTAFYKPTTPTDTQPISAATLPLPAGASTEATLSALNAKINTEITADYDTGAGVQTMKLTGLALPASGGAVAGGTATNPVRVDPTGTTTQPVSQGSGAALTGAWPVKLTDGTNTAPTMDTAARAGFQKITDGTNVEIVDPCANSALTRTAFVINQAAGAQIITGTASKQTYVCSIFYVTATAQNIALVEGTGTVCGTGTAGMAGGATTATGQNWGANMGFTNPATGFWHFRTATAADNVCLLQSGTGQISGGGTYVQN